MFALDSQMASDVAYSLYIYKSSNEGQITQIVEA